MLYAVITALLLLCAWAPQLWVRWVMHRHARAVPGMPGTGAELAEHLLRRFGLEGYVVETTLAHGDHFDPAARAVRLGPSNHAGRSLTAIAVAAHEVGHALQHHRRERIFTLRERYLPLARTLDRVGVMLLVALPVLALVFRVPSAMLAVAALSVALQLAGALTYLIVLPEEWDASFNKALPILRDGGYLEPGQEGPVRQVLQAAALTYFAGALASLLNLGRLLLVLRR